MEGKKEYRGKGSLSRAGWWQSADEGTAGAACKDPGECVRSGEVRKRIDGLSSLRGAQISPSFRVHLSFFCSFFQAKVYWVDRRRFPTSRSFLPSSFPLHFQLSSPSSTIIDRTRGIPIPAAFFSPDPHHKAYIPTCGNIRLVVGVGREEGGGYRYASCSVDNSRRGRGQLEVEREGGWKEGATGGKATSVNPINLSLKKRAEKREVDAKAWRDLRSSQRR